ncbi:MAG: hypothetical protein IH614_15160 [Desulfuromonadales bacterium]|nr:hypothetical protein [Desulfuromonadales bacterium]
MKKINYRCYSIYAEPGQTSSGTYDVRVILQKLKTSKITVYKPGFTQATSEEAEDRGIATGKELVEEKKCPEG